MNSSESIAKLAAALVGAQSEFEVVRHDSDNPFYKSKYASLGAMIESTVPVLKKHGLAISQLPASYPNEVGVETILMHESGEWISQKATIAMKDSPNPAQEAGKAITYLRRYGWQAVLGVYSGDDDDAQSLTQSAQKLGGVKKEVVTARPFTPEQLKAAMDSKVSTLSDVPENEKQRGVMVGLYEAILGDSISRYEVCEYLFGVRKSKDLSQAQIVAALNHINANEGLANRELHAVFNQSQKDKGQKELV